MGAVCPGHAPGKTLGIVGLGRVGDEANARRGRANGLRVVATRRTGTDGGGVKDVDSYFRMAGLQRLLGRE